MDSGSDVILIGEIHRIEDEVHQKAESELIPPPRTRICST